MREVDRLSQIVDELLVLSRAGERESPGEEVDLGASGRSGARSAGRDGRRARDRADPSRAPERRATCWCARRTSTARSTSLVENAMQLLAARARTVRDRHRAGPDRGARRRARGSRRARRRRSSSASTAAAPASGTEGTGLGLPIARELAGEWGGSVRLENRDEGGGARAVIELPGHAEVVAVGGESR